MLPKDINAENSEIVAAEAPRESMVGATVPVGGEAVAESYVHSQLQKTRKSLLMTQILSAVMVLGTLIYLGYITSTVRQSLQPVAAAEIADGLISEKITQQAQSLAQQTREKVPQLIAQLPDYAIKEMPGYRAQLENQIETDMRSHFETASKAMEGHIDDFLTTHKTEIASMLQTGQNQQATKQMGAALETEFYKFLKETPLDSKNETAQGKLNQTLISLQQVETRMKRLAANQNLTPSEKKMRRAIAIMSRNFDKHIKENGLTIAKMSS